MVEGKPSKFGQKLIWVGLALSSLVIGVGAGVGGFTFVYAKGGSYMTNDPKACANCHVMTAQYDGWQKSSHHAVAVCNDCHTPHNFIGKWTTKALNGFHHSLAFTTGKFHEPIQIGPRNLEITENACRHCHADITQQIDHMAFEITAQSSPISCIHCHKNVGHME